MAIQGGPDIVEDGLVLHLDAAEPLCFRGEPTTNLSPYTNGTVNRGSWPYGAYTHSIETTGEFVGWEKIVATSVGSATSNFIMHMGQFFPTSGVQYTGSIEFYSPYNNLRFEITGGQGIWIATRIGSSNKYYRTIETSISTNMAWYLRTIASTPANTAITNGVIYYRRAQFEQKPYYTDFTIGTRGSTVATGGGLLDITNNGNNGTINRAASPSAAFYNGDNKGSLVFNGVDDYTTTGRVIVPNSSSPYTVSVWCYRNRNNVGYEELLAQWTSATSSNSFFFGFNNSNVRFTDNWNSVTVPGAGNTGVWMNLVGVYSVSNAFIYLNGSLSATRGSGFSYTGTGNFIIGRQGELSGEYFSGRISNTSIYNKALSSAEIQQNYNALKGRYGLT